MIFLRTLIIFLLILPNLLLSDDHTWKYLSKTSNGIAFISEITAHENEKKYITFVVMYDSYKGLTAANGAKYFSQYDEDGIIDDILSRLSYKSSPRFLEIGVGGGLEIENNTINLLINGSSGIWIEASKRNVNEIKNSFHFFLKRNQLTLINKMITPYNIKEVLKGQISSIELFSLDIDSIDYYILKELLLINKFKPSVLVIEYNAIFGPSANVVVDYEACLKNNQKNSYFGASLLSYSKLLFNYNYILVCTGVTGSNAYFVRKDLINSSFDKKYLDNVKERVKYLYNPARYFLAWGIRSGMFPAVGPFRE